MTAILQQLFVSDFRQFLTHTTKTVAALDPNVEGEGGKGKRRELRQSSPGRTRILSRAKFWPMSRSSKRVNCWLKSTADALAAGK